MGRITLDLVRKRSEHNEGVVHTLEELSLHQEGLEKVECLDKWCRKIKILYLQANLIPKIENLNRMKCLEYLNLAMNNVEVIENLEGCESLKKLDLTVNFVGRISSVANLRVNPDLEDLYLTGNPCSDYEGYRKYVVATLPNLKWLDGVTVTRSERILAVQEFNEVERKVMEQEEAYLEKREAQKKDAEQKSKELEESGIDQDELDERYWNEATEFTPESRVETQRALDRTRAKSDQKPTKEDTATQRPRRLFGRNNEPLNVNEAQLQFRLQEKEGDTIFELRLNLYKYLDPSLLELDLEPTYVRVRVKGKVFQLVLPEEIQISSSSAQRSQITGQLVIRMPKLNAKVFKLAPAMSQPDRKKPTKIQSDQVRQTLGIGPPKETGRDLLTVVRNATDVRQRPDVHERINDSSFQDDPNVPALEAVHDL